MVLVPLAAAEIAGALPAAAIELGTARQAAIRLMDLLDRASAGVVNTGTEPVGSTASRFRGLCMDGRAGRSHRHDFTCPQGGRIAVIGPSGSGKTSLLLTVAGLLEPAGGEVLVGGLRSCFSTRRHCVQRSRYFAEDGHLFRTSIFENLRVANGELTVDTACRALTIVGLSDWVNGLPDRLDHVLTEGERSISAGQRRRLLLARALVSPARVLLARRTDRKPRRRQRTGSAANCSSIRRPTCSCRDGR